MSEGLLRNRNCRGCGVVFCVCGRCDHGQCYCSPLCRQRARRQQLRAANRRHQRTDAGRRLHRMRQRDYRLRRAEARVTDHRFPVIVLPGGTQREGCKGSRQSSSRREVRRFRSTLKPEESSHAHLQSARRRHAGCLRIGIANLARMQRSAVRADR